METAKRLWIRYGGSNRKLARDLELLKEKFGPDLRDVGNVYGRHHSTRNGVVPDTPENRKWIKLQKGITIDRGMN